MAYTNQLHFGPHVHIEMTRDKQRRICRLCTILQGQEEGYLLETDGAEQAGRLFILPSRTVHEEYKSGAVFYPRQNEDEQRDMNYESWINSCVQQATAWARSYAIQVANESIGEGEFLPASQTYYDVIDHFPPPPDGPLLHWNYYRCIARMEGIETAREGLLLWLQEALPIAGIDVTTSILEPAKELLGDDIAEEAAKVWLSSSSPHDPAHKMTKRWLERLNSGGGDSLKWLQGTENPLGIRDSLLIPLQNGDIMAVGGIDDDGKPSSKAAIWHYQGKTWTSIASLPYGIQNHSGIAHSKGGVIVVGGRGESERFSNKVFSWSYTDDIWKEVEPLRIGREFCGVEMAENGQVVVMGGEDPLQTNTSIECWDRRTQKWSQEKIMGLYFPEVKLVSFSEGILLTGASISTSGFGALIFQPRSKKWMHFESLRGVGLDGALPMNADEFVVWRKKSTELDVGIWNKRSDTIQWTCKDIEILDRIDLCEVHVYDDERCIITFVNSKGFVQSQMINPKSGNVEDQLNMGDDVILCDGGSQIRSANGIFILHKEGWAFI